VVRKCGNSRQESSRRPRPPTFFTPPIVADRHNVPERLRHALGIHARACRVQTKPNRRPKQPARNQGVRPRRYRGARNQTKPTEPMRLMVREDTTLLPNVPYILFWHSWRPKKEFNPSLSLSLPLTPFLSTAGSCEDLRIDSQYSSVRLVFIFIVFGIGTPTFGSFGHVENEWVGSFRELSCRWFPHFQTTSIVFGAL